MNQTVRSELMSRVWTDADCRGLKSSQVKTRRSSLKLKENLGVMHK